MKPQHLLIPTDYSAGSEAALRKALTLARSEGDRLTLLHVYSLPGHIASPDGVWVPPTALLQSLEASERERMELEVRRIAACTSVKVEGSAVLGEAAFEIVRTARRENCDMIIMGTHGRTGFRHWVLGSVAERVVRTADCPVLTVRVPGQRFELPEPVGRSAA